MSTTATAQKDGLINMLELSQQKKKKKKKDWRGQLMTESPSPQDQPHWACQKGSSRAGAAALQQLEQGAHHPPGPPCTVARRQLLRYSPSSAEK